MLCCADLAVSLCFNVQFAQVARIMLVLPFEERTEICAAHPRWVNCLCRELDFHLWCRKRGLEYCNELRNARLSRCYYAVPNRNFEVSEAGLGNGGNIRYVLDPVARNGDKRPQIS